MAKLRLKLINGTRLEANLRQGPLRGRPEVQRWTESPERVEFPADLGRTLAGLHAPQCHLRCAVQAWLDGSNLTITAAWQLPALSGGRFWAARGGDA
jgi:hypothetical protein